MVTYESATSRLGRLLIMVPWLLNRQGIDLASAAQELGVSQEQVIDDLQLLFVCGLPGHYPDDLIEASWEGGRVFVSNADTMWTYRHLIEKRHRPHWTDRRIDKGRYSMGLFVWYFGTDRQYSDVPHHMMLLGPRYEELLKDIFKRHKLAGTQTTG